ncbi:MAG: LysM peptidoglycan-binding domain-containing protein [Spartobacteria bacterium]
MSASDKFATLLLSILAAGLTSGCDRMMTPRNAQIVKDADAKMVQGNYARAINLYEAALDDTPGCADIHYKLALIYDDKLSDPLNALHHFKRYLSLSPNGARATEVKSFVKRDEISLLTSLSGDSVVPRTEAARLKNENLDLRKQVEERSAKTKPVIEKAQAVSGHSAKAGRRSYVVEPGDTLFSIARQFYKSSSRWKEIRDANAGKIDKGDRLKPGETLIIP